MNNSDIVYIGNTTQSQISKLTPVVPRRINDLVTEESDASYLG
jgi:hypothetical protein